MHYQPPQSTPWTRTQIESFLSLPDETIKIALAQLASETNTSYEKMMTNTDAILKGGKNFNERYSDYLVTLIREALIQRLQEN